MLNDSFEEIGETLRNLPKEIGTEAIAQVKNNANPKQNQKQSDADYQKYLQDLYGTSDMTSDQIETKKSQDGRIVINNYRKIQQDIQEYRAKKSKQKTKYEIGWQEGTEAARTQEEEMELWEKQQKKALEQKKKRESDARSPGGAAARSGEQGKIMG